MNGHREEVVLPYYHKDLTMVQYKQGWEFALWLLCSSLFPSKSLILKSDYERRALVSLLLFTKERRERFALYTRKLLFCSQTTSDLLKKPMSEFPTLRVSILIGII